MTEAHGVTASNSGGIGVSYFRGQQMPNNQHAGAEPPAEKSGSISDKNIRILPKREEVAPSKALLNALWRSPEKFGFIVTRDPSTNYFRQTPVALEANTQNDIIESLAPELDA